MVNFPDHISPHHIGLGLRAPHYREVISSSEKLADWWEVHSENFFSKGGITLEVLHKIRERYPVSFHGVGLSLGSSSPLKMHHLNNLATLVARFDPALVSEHLSWSAAGDVFANDLLPLPLTEEALSVVVTHIVQVQDVLKRQILIENPSSYLQFTGSVIPEWEFMAEIAKRSGCGLLLDVNNIYVSVVNHGYDGAAYIAALPCGSVKEIHLAGHNVQHYGNKTLLIDDHGTYVAEEVWQLYRLALKRFGAVPTLIEWDTDIPPLEVLRQEAAKAALLINRTIY